MELIVIVALLAVIEFIALGARVGLARGRTGVAAPAVTGNDEFERHFRVHYNTLEQLVVFLPGLWAFGTYVDPMWGAAIGAIYLIGRIIYAVSYVKDPATRGTGMLMTVLPCYVLVLGGLAGVIWSMVG